jgi:hypothetical protein
MDTVIAFFWTAAWELRRQFTDGLVLIHRLFLQIYKPRRHRTRKIENLFSFAESLQGLHRGRKIFYGAGNGICGILPAILSPAIVSDRVKG